MEALVAVRYVKALEESIGSDSMENASVLFSALSSSFDNKQFIDIMNHPDVTSEQKESILLDAVKSAQSDAINNFIKILVEHNRIMVIPAIADTLRKKIADTKKEYTGSIFSNTDMDASSIEGIAKGLGKKLDATISLDFIKSDFDGIKVEVEDLGIEINFSKSRLNNQLVEHILKAI